MPYSAWSSPIRGRKCIKRGSAPSIRYHRTILPLRLASQSLLAVARPVGDIKGPEVLSHAVRGRGMMDVPLFTGREEATCTSLMERGLWQRVGMEDEQCRSGSHGLEKRKEIRKRRTNSVSIIAELVYNLWEQACYTPFPGQFRR